MKYKAGDRVEVREVESKEVFRSMDLQFLENNYKDYIGKVVTIEEVRLDYYKIKEDGGKGKWFDEMLKVPTVPDVIEYFMFTNGLKVGQMFTIQHHSCKFHFNESGKLIGGESEASPSTFCGLLTGEYRIKSKFQELKGDDEFWYVSPVGVVERGRLDCCSILGKALMMSGNFFLRQKDAEDCKSLIMLKWKELEKNLEAGVEVGV